MSGNTFRIAMPILLVIATVLYWQHHQRIFADRGRLNVSQERQAIVLSWHSDIDVPMATRFSEAFSRHRAETGKFIIDLDSPGGALLEGGKVIELMNRMKATHRIETRVGAYNNCLSMCVPIFLAGEKRIASASSRWMFHEPRSSDYFTGEEVIEPEIERRYYNNRFFEKYFTNSAMDARWRENLRKEWVGQDVWKTGRELVDEGSNIITRLN